VNYITEETAKAIMAECLANQERLVACERHDFARDADNPDRFTCRVCSGWISSQCHSWWSRGWTQGFQEGSAGTPQGSGGKRRKA
jgi:hypothetical protein